MCELAYIHTSNREINIPIAYALAYVDGAKNKDGTGFYSTRLWKSFLTGSTIINLAQIMSTHIVDNSPIILHTRLATSGVNGSRVVSDDNSHPFEGNEFVLAHNGSLDPKVALTKEQKESMKVTVDSAYFLTCLERTAGDTFADRLQKAMDDFTGKFAFLIHSKTTGEDYAIRGFSANLHIIPIYRQKTKDEKPPEKIGYVINTDKDHLIAALVLARNICNMGKNGFDFNTDEVKELDRESIYLLGKEATKIGEIKENFRTTYSQAHSGQGTYSRWESNTDSIAYGTGSAKKPGQKMLLLAKEWGLSVLDVDRITRFVFDRPLVLCSNGDLEDLDTVATELIKRSVPRQVEIWKELLNYRTADNIYTSESIPFPFCFADQRVLAAILRRYKG